MTKSQIMKKITMTSNRLKIFGSYFTGIPNEPVSCHATSNPVDTDIREDMCEYSTEDLYYKIIYSYVGADSAF